MAPSVERLWLALGVTCLLVNARLPCCHGLRSCPDQTKVAVAIRQALAAMLATEHCPRSSALLVADDSPWAASVLLDQTNFGMPWGVSIFKMSDGVDANVTHLQLAPSVAEARQVREVSWCVTVVVMSENPAFLSAFTESSFKSHLLLLHSARLLTFTRLPLYRLQTIHHLHKTFSRTNSLIAVIDQQSPTVRLAVYSMLPYSDPNAFPLRVATWTLGQGLVLTSAPHLFPEKIFRFPHLPHLLVTAEEIPYQLAVMEDDPSAPEGQRLSFTGPAGNIMQILSNKMNFTYSFMRPADRSWGVRLSDGTWSGMMGLIVEEKVEMTPGPIFMSHIRSTVTDFSSYINMGGYKVLAARGRPEADPWGFLLPLSPLVWVAMLTALLVVLAVMLVLPSCLPEQTLDRVRRKTKMFNCVRVMLQEDIKINNDWWWWERVVLGVWMIMMLVMTKSYEGNLMSLLAVRHIDHPYQSLGDVLDNDIKIVILESNSLLAIMREASSGPLKEVGILLDTERVRLIQYSEITRSMKTIVRDGTHILFDVAINFRTMVPNDFSLTGRCDFYISRSIYLSNPITMLTQKNSVLMPVLTRLAAALVESGLYDRWVISGTPNATSCNNPPMVITVNTALSLTNLWGMFAVLGCGFVLGLVVLLVENVAVRASVSTTPTSD